MKIIKLTETGPTSHTRPLYVHAFWIKSFCLGDKKKDTMVCMYDKSYYFVKEDKDLIEWALRFLAEGFVR